MKFGSKHYDITGYLNTHIFQFPIVGNTNMVEGETCQVGATLVTLDLRNDVQY
jgi:hypothetical protein